MKILLALLLASISIASSQDQYRTVFIGAHAGRSEPGVFALGGFAGGGGDSWETGYIVGGEVQWNFTKANWSCFVSSDWSRHNRKTASWEIPASNSPHMTTTDITVGVRYAFSLVYLKGGAAFSIQHRDDIIVDVNGVRSIQEYSSTKNSFGSVWAV
jgi:hypothetical protein